MGNAAANYSEQPRSLQLLLVDSDPIFRLGLRTALQPFGDLQVRGEATNAVEALALLEQNGPGSIDLVVLALALEISGADPRWNLGLCRQLRSRYPQLPILLLGNPGEEPLLAIAYQLGVTGYSPKEIALDHLIQILRQVGQGQPCWPAALAQRPPTTPAPVSILALLRQNLGQSSVAQIEAALAELNAYLQSPGIAPLDRLLLTGRRRELRAARWLVSQMFPLASTPSGSGMPPASPPLPVPSVPAPLTLPGRLFDRTFSQLQSSLENLTDRTLEIDILREEKKRDLLYLVLRKLEDSLGELRYSGVQPDQLGAKRQAILQDIWQATTIDFFGKYSTLRVGGQIREVVPSLLADREVVGTAILDRIPLVPELLAYLLFQTALVVDNTVWEADSSPATERAEVLLQNLTLRLACAVLQPLLNHFADVEAIKQNLYDRRRLSSREIERFRNDLSWYYRVERYITEPRDIFESQFQLIVLTERGIDLRPIYNPRRQELEQLTGIPLLVTLALETRDALSPRLRSTLAFVGSGVVYVLTELVGRGLGLIGRGIIKGIGNALQDNRIR